jgi:hypothetical protein
MRVLVCGGRDYADERSVFAALDALDQKYGHLTIIQGGARGADELARRWCKTHGAQMVNAPADWKRYGRAAGLIRNQRMLDEYRPNLIVAFPGGRGTADMVRRARATGIEVVEFPGAPLL